jgi:hypothetical protein
VHHGVIRKKPGADVRDPDAFDLHDSFQMAWQQGDVS